MAVNQRPVENSNNNPGNTQLLSYVLMNDPSEKIVVVDRDGVVIELSNAYAEFLRVDREKSLGQHVTKVIENTRMHVVLKTGVAEMEATQEINGHRMIANRIPIFDNGQIVGAYGRVIFRDLQELDSLYNRVVKIEEELKYYKDNFTSSNTAKYSIGDIIGNSALIKEARDKIVRVGKSTSNVLIVGESGTGKELYAHALHLESPRKNQAFICLNCAAVPNELLESELFGYTEGSFTGAKKGGKIGILKAADGGTVFLDEIAEMSLPMQAKMLRVLQEREVQRIGATSPETVDVRIIAATNKDIKELVEQGLFREDLYYRLNVVQIPIPPLRYRKDDIPLLSKHFIEKANEKNRMNIKGISDEAMEYLMDYEWPGNIRELENIIEGAGNFIGEDGMITPHQLPPQIAANASIVTKDENLAEQLEEVEKNIILRSLMNNHGSKVATAKALGISRTSLYEKMQKHDISYSKERKAVKKND